MDRKSKMTSLGLVADYASSSGSDSESEAEISTNRQEKESKTQLNLLTSQDTSSSSDSDSPNQESARKSVGKGDCPLPLPQVFASSEPTEGTSKNLLSLSVFANPFEQARQDRLSILEKHVKLKEQEKADGAARGNKKVCYKFQKGKCRFGDTCKFSHGSKDPPLVLTGGNREAYPSTASEGYMGAPYQDHGFHDEGQRAEEEEETIRKRKKDRAGLSEKLIPSKKAMRIYDRQRVQDRPWTTKR